MNKLSVKEQYELARCAVEEIGDLSVDEIRSHYCDVIDEFIKKDVSAVAIEVFRIFVNHIIEEKEGKARSRVYATNYPNLAELHHYHAYGEPAICDHAGITNEVLYGILYRCEELQPDKMLGLAKLYCISYGVLKQPYLIMLDMDRPRHKQLVEDVRQLMCRLRYMAESEHNEKAAKYLDIIRPRYEVFKDHVERNELSYCHYFSMNEWASQMIMFSKSERTPRNKPKRSKA